MLTEECNKPPLTPPKEGEFRNGQYNLGIQNLKPETWNLKLETWNLELETLN